MPEFVTDFSKSHAWSMFRPSTERHAKASLEPLERGFGHAWEMPAPHSALLSCRERRWWKWKSRCVLHEYTTIEVFRKTYSIYC